MLYEVITHEDGLKFICSKGLEHLEIHTNTGGNLRFIPTTDRNNFV